MIELGAGAKHNDEFMLVAKPYLQNYQRLVRKQSILESCFRIMYFYPHGTCRAALPSGFPASRYTTLLLLSWKIFLAYQTNKELEHYFKVHHPIKRTINTRTTKEALLQESEKIRRDGIAHDHEEYDYGLSCIAAPIFLGENLAAGISLSGPTSRLQYKGYAFLERNLKQQQKPFQRKQPSKGCFARP